MTTSAPAARDLLIAELRSLGEHPTPIGVIPVPGAASVAGARRFRIWLDERRHVIAAIASERSATTIAAELRRVLDAPLARRQGPPSLADGAASPGDRPIQWTTMDAGRITRIRVLCAPIGRRPLLEATGEGRPARAEFRNAADALRFAALLDEHFDALAVRAPLQPGRGVPLGSAVLRELRHPAGHRYLALEDGDEPRSLLGPVEHPEGLDALARAVAMLERHEVLRERLGERTPGARHIPSAAEWRYAPTRSPLLRTAPPSVAVRPEAGMDPAVCEANGGEGVRMVVRMLGEQAAEELARALDDAIRRDEADELQRTDDLDGPRIGGTEDGSVVLELDRADGETTRYGVTIDSPDGTSPPAIWLESPDQPVALFPNEPTAMAYADALLELMRSTHVRVDASAAPAPLSPGRGTWWASWSRLTALGRTVVEVRIDTHGAEVTMRSPGRVGAGRFESRDAALRFATALLEHRRLRADAERELECAVISRTRVAVADRELVIVQGPDIDRLPGCETGAPHLAIAGPGELALIGRLQSSASAERLRIELQGLDAEGAESRRSGDPAYALGFGGRSSVLARWMPGEQARGPHDLTGLAIREFVGQARLELRSQSDFEHLAEFHTLEAAVEFATLMDLWLGTATESEAGR